jgi:predicted Zn finger-like uncharacterized protein
MILTCPACDTKYVVKDGAIPPAGRQVRCASCKHSWHQGPDETALAEPESPLIDQPSAAVDFGGPPPADPADALEPAAEIPAEAGAEAMIAEYPEPDVEPSADRDLHDEAEWHPAVDDDSETGPAAYAEEPHDPPAAVAEADEWRPPAQAEEEFVGYAPIEADEQAPRRWPMLLGLIILIAAAAAAFWFLAPTEWKARAGIAQANSTPLELMITNRDRQMLESGNELVAISGRVINPTDSEQRVPPIRAVLRDSRTKALIHSWTIAAPAQVLAPRSSASFNSAEVDVPKGGDELTVTLGG